MLTADTITDAQIRELRSAMFMDSARARRIIEECNLALDLPAGFDRDQWRHHIA